MAILPFALYAGRNTIEITDKNRRSEHGSIDEALAALGWLQRQEQLDWAAIVNVESDEIAWRWEAESTVSVSSAKPKHQTPSQEHSEHV